MWATESSTVATRATWRSDRQLGLAYPRDSTANIRPSANVRHCPVQKERKKMLTRSFPRCCSDVQCGMPARIGNGGYKLVNDSRHYLSMVSYSCSEGYQLIGRADLICDVDGRWNGPPPRCERKKKENVRTASHGAEHDVSCPSFL